MQTPQEVYNNASRGLWDKIIFEELTKEHASYKGFAQDTILHVAARAKKLHLIPKKLLCEELLNQRSAGAITVFQEAAISGEIFCIPPKLLTIEKLTEVKNRLPSILENAISYRTIKHIPKKVISKELLMTLFDQGDSYRGDTYAHEIARRGLLGQLPHSVLTKDILMLRDKTGNTVANYAVRSGEIKYFPQFAITKELVENTNNLGENLLHWAAIGRHIKLIPKGYITQRLLDASGQSGESVFHMAAKGHCLNQIPKNFLTPKALIQCKSRIENKSPIELFFNQYSPKDKNTLRLLLSILNKEDLIGIKSLDKSQRMTIKKLLLEKEVKSEEAPFEL